LHDAVKPTFKILERNNRVFSVAGDGRVREHKLGSEKVVREFVGHKDWVYALDFDEKNNRLATAGYDGEVKIWEISSGKCLLSFVASPGLNASVEP
jgi:WD40 repeat protein